MRRLPPSRLLFLAVMAFSAFASTAGNVEKGKTIFQQRCGVCHSVTAAGGPIMGPNMLGLVGRKAGTQPEFRMYSTALKESKLTWDVKTLDSFLTAPPSKVPGTTMPMSLPDKAERADVIAYLGTLKK